MARWLWQTIGTLGLLGAFLLPWDGAEVLAREAERLEPAWTGAVQPVSPTSGPPGRAPGTWIETDFDTADGWYAFSLPQDSPSMVGLDRGILYLQLPAPFVNVYVLYEQPLVGADVRLEAVVESVSDVTANNISLVCRANEAGWYEFSINSGGFWHIWKLASGEFQELASGPTRVINQKRAKNVISATCVGSELRLDVNYRRVGSARDRDFLDGGQVGIGVSSFALPGVAVDVDRFSAAVP